MPRVPPFDRRATYQDLEQVPALYVAELVGGELYSTPRPRPLHAVAGAALGGRLLPPYFDGHGGPGGWWILYEPEIHLGEDVLVPDWAGWRRSRMPRVPTTAYFPIAPDWVCEILSPSTVELDRERKLAIYARERIPHAWLVDPEARVLEVLRLTDGVWEGLARHAADEVVRAEPFADVSLDLRALWGA